MTLQQFENGYWYTTDLKAFAEAIGIPAAKKLRKDELEKAIKSFLTNGQTKLPTRRSLKKSGTKDLEKGLTLSLAIENYTSNKKTKEFILREANKLVPDLKPRSGAWYRLNRWREDQLTRSRKITYRDLIAEYVRLNQSEEPFARIPHGRYINFVADFLAAEKSATRARAISAWKKLKRMDVPKTYRAWAKANRKS
jgi:hypothetical protein